ncbi:MAG: ATP-binding protein, partial [Pseudomonadota bacterium]
MRFSLRKLGIALLIALILSVANAEIYRTADQVTPLLPGAEVPAFTALNLEGEPVDIMANTIERPIVLTFYRGGWCPYCNLHLAELRTAEEELKALGSLAELGVAGRGVLVAVSGGVDSTVLLDVLAAMAPDRDLKLTVGHVRHGLRGAESEADAH